MEKHWSSVVSRSVCDYLFEAQTKSTSAADLPPVISTPHYYIPGLHLPPPSLRFACALEEENMIKERTSSVQGTLSNFVR